MIVINFVVADTHMSRCIVANITQEDGQQRTQS